MQPSESDILSFPFQISIQALILTTAGGDLGKSIWRPLGDGAHHLRSLCASNSCWADVLGLLQVETRENGP